MSKNLQKSFKNIEKPLKTANHIQKPSTISENKKKQQKH